MINDQLVNGKVTKTINDDKNISATLGQALKPAPRGDLKLSNESGTPINSSQRDSGFPIKVALPPNTMMPLP